MNLHRQLATPRLVPLTALAHLNRVVANVRVDATLSAAEVESSGARCIQASTDDVLGLGADARVREAAIGAIRKFGLAPGPSTRLRDEIESRLARHLGVEAAILVPDLAVLTSLPGRVAVDGRTARRLDVIASEPHQVEPGCLMIADAIHPFEGDFTLLPRMIDLAAHQQATLLAVEAVGLGVLGPAGGGVCDHLGLTGLIDLQALWLGALGAQGWLLAGKNLVINAARGFGSAAPSVPAMAATLRALEILHVEPQRRVRAFDVAQTLINALRERGLDTGPCVTPWVPVWLGDEALTEQWLRALLEAGVAARALLAGRRSRLLFSVAATISDTQFELLLEGIDRVARKLPVPDSLAPRAQVTVSRPGTFVMSAPCGPQWVEVDQPDAAATKPQVTDVPRSLSARVFDTVETLTWRATNFRTARLPGSHSLWAFINRTRNRRG